MERAKYWVDSIYEGRIYFTTKEAQYKWMGNHSGEWCSTEEVVDDDPCYGYEKHNYCD